MRGTRVSPLLTDRKRHRHFVPSIYSTSYTVCHFGYPRSHWASQHESSSVSFVLRSVPFFFYHCRLARSHSHTVSTLFRSKGNLVFFSHLSIHPTINASLFFHTCCYIIIKSVVLHFTRSKLDRLLAFENERANCFWELASSNRLLSRVVFYSFTRFVCMQRAISKAGLSHLHHLGRKRRNCQL